MKKSNKNSMITAFAVSLAIGLMGPIGALAAGPAAVNLGSAGNFVVLSKTGISTTGATSIVGDIGVSPAAASYITGFALTLPVAGAFSTSALVTGKIYAPGYADPTPANITAAVSDMQTAYTDAAGRTNPTATELGAGNIGGMTLAPGLYKWSTGLTIPTDVTLSGSANDVWIFQVAGNLNISSAVKVLLAGGANTNNIFWVVAGQTTLGTTSVFEGTILDQTAIVLNTGAQLNGRALAQAAVTLDSNIVALASPTNLPISASVTSINPQTPVASSTNPGISVTPPSGTNTTITSTGSANSSQTGVGQGMQASVVSSGATADQQAELNSLLVTLHSLQAQVSAAPKYPELRAVTVDLGMGSKGNNVTILQEFLISRSGGVAAHALQAVGATGYFGTLTRQALAEFQAAAHISPALGNFGSVTRAYINSYY